MKNLVLVSVASVIMAATTYAQSEISLAKTDVTKLQGQESVTKKEAKDERKKLKKLEGNAVSLKAKQAFSQDFGYFPSAIWRRGDYYDEVAFTNKQGEKMIAYYDFNAQLVGTTMHKNFSDIPTKAQNYIHKKYMGYKVSDVIFFDDNEVNETDMILYGAQFDDEDNYFVALEKGNQTTIVRVNMSGDVDYFKKI